MPISIDTFEGDTTLTAPSISEQVLTYLARHSEQAFTRSELAAAIDADANAVGSALSRLKKRGLVRHRDTYWAITDDRERLRAAGELHGLFEHLAADETEGFDEEAWLQSATPVTTEHSHTDESAQPTTEE